MVAKEEVEVRTLRLHTVFGVLTQSEDLSILTVQYI